MENEYGIIKEGMTSIRIIVELIILFLSIRVFGDLTQTYVPDQFHYDFGLIVGAITFVIYLEILKKKGDSK